VRCLLVPAVMVLMGRVNWWLPRWLDRLLPHVNIEGTEFFGEDQRFGEAQRVRVESSS
jgi:uncharacterized membrane protein YdfJ with MMPL/SSD domain